jgi:hypothetical protein
VEGCKNMPLESTAERNKGKCGMCITHGYHPLREDGNENRN